MNLFFKYINFVRLGSQKKFHDVDLYVNFKFKRGRREKVDIIMKQKAR